MGLLLKRGRVFSLCSDALDSTLVLGITFASGLGIGQTRVQNEALNELYAIKL